MGMTKKSHGRKTDQETQSPMLKIFKDIIQRDKDPEKTNLLKDNHEDNRKKRHYSSSKSKMGHKNESSSSERSRRTVSYKTQETRNLEYDHCRPRSTPFQGDRKESWWFWGEKNSNRDTRSCVSCALKKLGGSEYFCVGCLLLIFVVSVAVAFLLVFRSVPTIAADVSPTPSMLDSDLLRRKMDALNEKKEKKFGLKADPREKREWDSTVWKQMDGQGSLTRTDFGRSGLNDMVSIEGNEMSDLSSILGDAKINEFQNNDRLREFFKKLAQTEAQIRLLKKGMQDQSFSTSESEKTLKNLFERSKRSINFKHAKFTHKNKTFNISKENSSRKGYFRRPFYILKRGKTKDARNKRFSNDSEPTGFFIENKKVLVQYMPPAETRKIPKCSHSAKDSKSHEKLLKHPFYKNTQRLDEMLDQFIAKNLHDLVNNPYSLDMLMQKKKEKCKHPKTNEDANSEHKVAKPKEIKIDVHKISDDVIKKLLQPLDTTKLLEKDAKKMAINLRHEKVGLKESTRDYDIILSISTILNPDVNVATTPISFARSHVFRKLMQIDEEDEENIGYEDLKEVLAEDIEAHDERDSHGDRKKREESAQSSPIPNVPSPPGVNNPNWKGAMPLYPDEINAMIKQAALNANKLVLFKNKEGKEIFSPKDALEAEDENDVQYIEEYFNSKYNRLVNMAQAYSDYGVLDGKRNGVGTEKAGDDKILEHRVKLSVNGGFRDKLLGRLKKGAQASEGIRFELRPTAPSRDDTPLGVSKLLHKHVQISAGKIDEPSAQAPKTMLPANPEIDFMFSPTKYDKHVEYSTKKKHFKNDDVDGAITFHQSRRSLKSINDKEDLNEDGEEELAEDENKFDIINEGQTGVILFDYLKDSKISPSCNLDTKEVNVKKPLNFENDNKEHKNKQSIMKNNITSGNTKLKTINPATENITKQQSKNNTINNNRTQYLEAKLINGPYNTATIIHNNTEEYIRNAHRNIPSTTRPFEINDDATNDIFIMLTNFFSFLEDFDLALKLNTSLNPHFKPNNNDNNNLSYVNTSVTSSPPYVTKMFANIGYRSRVLMSVNESMKIDTVLNEATTIEQSTERIESAKIAETNSTLVNITENKTKLENDENIANAAPKRDKGLENKTVVKRNADDSNLIFWNDIYDDEYGVRVEPADSVRDKHSVPKTSSTWFKDKFRKLTDNLRMQPNKGTDKTRISRDVRDTRKSLNRIERNSGRIDKRDLKLVETDEFLPDQDFATLNANMKEVCRKAARAVQQTKNLEVKEDTKESAAATTLMQQLVKLMTDLVDYQVQQRTCLQLPPDLQSFLEWLTEPGHEGVPDTNYKRGFQEDFLTDLETNLNDEKPTDHYLSMEMITPTTSEREEVHPEERSDCLGTLRAVQDLILQYDELSDEEKSKMVGIREYLDNQLDYLEKHIVSGDEFNVNQKSDFPLRFKRNAFGRKTNNEKRDKTNKGGKIRQRIKSLLKFKNKKHTKTMRVSLVQTTEVNHPPRKHKAKSYVGSTFEPQFESNALGQTKRNLKDVYFKAIADAKKITTVKHFAEFRD